jgi:hypothetical protein
MMASLDMMNKNHGFLDWRGRQPGAKSGAGFAC